MQTEVFDRALTARVDASRPRPGLWIPIAIASLIAFAALQFFVERGANSALVGPPGGAVTHFEVDWPTVRYQLAGDVARFLGLGLAGITLALRGRRRVFWIPAASYVTAPRLIGWGESNCQVLGRLPAAIGAGWRPASAGCDSAAAAGWGPALLGLALVLLPAIVLVATRRPRSSEPFFAVPTTSNSSTPTLSQVATIGVAGFGVWATLWAWQLAGTRPSPFIPHMPNVIPLLAFGLLLGTLRPRLAWTLPVTAILLSTYWPHIPLPGLGFRMSDSLWQTFVSSLPSSWPYLALPVLAASWKPAARALEALAERPRQAVVLLNVLNVIDALFTSFAVRSEGAVEANPVVRVLGMLAKAVLVGALSIVVFRVRPRALGWLVLVFGVVLIWHLAGFWASPR